MCDYILTNVDIFVKSGQGSAETVKSNMIEIGQYDVC